MKRIILLLLLNISCTPNHTKMTFDQFVNEFESIENYSMDSNNLSRINDQNPFVQLEDRELVFVRSQLEKQKCDSISKYLFFKVGKYKSDDKVHLLYYLTANNKCQFDGVENLFLLGVYDKKGKLISEKTIGKYYSVFGVTELQSFDYKPDSSMVRMNNMSESLNDSNQIVSRTKASIYKW